MLPKGKGHSLPFPLALPSALKCLWLPLVPLSFIPFNLVASEHAYGNRFRSIWLSCPAGCSDCKQSHPFIPLYWLTCIQNDYPWTGFPSFDTPANTNNQCDQKEQGGYGFQDLPLGGFQKYGNLDFSGFSCTNGLSGHKRSFLRSRTFGNVCGIHKSSVIQS